MTRLGTTHNFKIAVHVYVLDGKLDREQPAQCKSKK